MSLCRGAQERLPRPAASHHMTTLATLLGLIPLALALEAGSEQYAPLARAIIGGLMLSFLVTLFLVPSAYLLMHRKEEEGGQQEVQL